MEVTLNLPEQLYRKFSKLAEKKHRRVDEVKNAEARTE